MQIKPKRTVLVVSNDGAGGAHRSSEIAAARSLLAESFKLKDCSISDIISDVRTLQLCNLYDPYAIIAVGGDGTVNACAQAAVAHNVRLGVLPAGTFNHFAKHLKIPLDISAAAEIIVNDPAIDIDVGEVNGRLFVNFASFGVYANIIRRREQFQKQGASKWVGFFRALTLLFRDKNDFKLKLTNGNSSFEQEAALVFIGNGSFDFGSFDVLRERTNVDSGRLQVIIMHDRSRRTLLLLAFLSLFININNRLGFDSVHLEHLTVETQTGKPVVLSLDGEVISMRSPLEFKKRIQALRVLAPAPERDK